MEVFDLYDRNRMPLGRTIERGQPMPDGCYHIVVHLCIFRPSGEMLIQQRQPFKADWPGRWDMSCGGCAVMGEDSLAAITREMQEELGLTVSGDSIRPVMTVHFTGGFDDIYTMVRDIDLQDLRLQAEEVRSVRWASLEQVLQMIDDGDFIPYYKDLIRFLFYMQNHKGTLQIGP